MSAVKSRNIVILGASGNLALTKLLPSLYTLYTSGAMPQNFSIIGYSRTAMPDEKFREIVLENLKSNVEETALEATLVENFLTKLYYCSGQYDSTEDFEKLKGRLEEVSELYPIRPRTLYYLSTPPSVFEPVANALKESGLVTKGEDSLENVIVEKPFGYDTDSAKVLNEKLYETFDEKQIYRIDHYLGKEAIQNLLVLRFANIIFEPVWNRNYIESVMISWEEDKHIGSRGGYFDESGIIRDVIQNHLLQILSLVAMEQPTSLSSSSICTEKIKALKCIKPVTLDDTVIGQYTDGVCAGKSVIGYTKEDSVPDESKRDTYAMIKCDIDNHRWSGVPFYLRAGKALTKSSTEIIINFKEVPGNIFKDSPHGSNKLVIRVQPDAGKLFHITNKVPGKGMVLKDVKFDFTYNESFNQTMPGAYERLLLDAINGDKTLFISYEELIHSWEIFTPILKKIDKGEAPVHYYAAGTAGPEESEKL